ncbi:unnamed protein product [Amaranthus hypochondriacus]
MAVGSLRHQYKGKFNMSSFRVSCRTILDHPFLVVLLLSLICLHRYFPFIFYLLITASPVFICTAILLGTLLIYGRPNENNVKWHGEHNNRSVSLRTGVENHAYSTDREGIFSKDIFSEVRKDIVGKGMRSTPEMLGSETRVNGKLGDEVKWEFSNLELNKGTTFRGEMVKKDYGFADFEKANFLMRADHDYDKTNKVHHDDGAPDPLETSIGIQKDEDGVVNHGLSDCESDGADKSSFDALVAGVIPAAQETHPLLDTDDPLHLDAPQDDNFKFELQSLDSNQSSEESGEDEHDDDDHGEGDDILKAKDRGDNFTNAWMELEKSQHLESLITRSNDEGEEDGEIDEDEGIEDEIDDDDDEDDEEENTNLENIASKHVTMWTEEDEKNLRLVGNSELERDLRLENLLARRRAKRNFSMISERNLIDLDRPIHSPFQVAPISTTRINPFDSPHDANQQHFSSVPSIPGSAPSVHLPRKNPFDSPCTSPKGIQNLTEDILKEKPLKRNSNNADAFHENESSSTEYSFTGNILKPDFVKLNRKDPVFRRYESFSTGYSSTGNHSRQANFIETDRRDALLRRHETFNTRSGFHNNFSPPEKLSSIKMKPVFVPEQVIGNQGIRHPSPGRDSSHGSASDSESSHDSESTVSTSDSNNQNIKTEEDAEPQFEEHQAKDDIAEGDHASSNYEDMSYSSEGINSEDKDVEDEFVDSLEANAELNDQIYQKAEAEYHDNTAPSSSSVASEASHSSEIVEEAALSPKASSTVSDAITEPPIFDTSPSGADKITPFTPSLNQEV